MHQATLAIGWLLWALPASGAPVFRVTRPWKYVELLHDAVFSTAASAELNDRPRRVINCKHRRHYDIGPSTGQDRVAVHVHGTASSPPARP